MLPPTLNYIYSLTKITMHPYSTIRGTSLNNEQIFHTHFQLFTRQHNKSRAIFNQNQVNIVYSNINLQLTSINKIKKSKQHKHSKKLFLTHYLYFTKLINSTSKTYMHCNKPFSYFIQSSNKLRLSVG